MEVEEINNFNAKTTDKNLKVAKIENTHELPFEFIKLELCKLFSCLPSQIEKEDYQELIKLYTLNNALESYKSWHNDEKTPVRLKIRMEILKLERQLEQNA